MTDGLTDKQTACLNAIRAHMAANGCAPTLKELSAALGVTKNAIVERMWWMQKKGWIERGGGWRAIRVLR